MSEDNIVTLPVVRIEREPQSDDPNLRRELVDGIALGQPITLPDGNTLEVTANSLGFEDMEAAINMRLWLQDAVEAKGADVVGSGYGFGAGDLDLVIEGHRYNVSIRPLS